MSTDEVYSGDSLDRWRSSFLAKTAGIGQKRVNWILHHLQEISKYAFETGAVGKQGLRLSMLASERVRERPAPKTKYTVWTYDQYQRFISTFDDGDRYIVLFQWLFFSGCRIGEALALQWSDVDFEKSEVSITKSSSPGVGTGRTEIFTPKTSAGVRELSVSAFMMSQLRKLRDNNGWGPSDYLFFGKAPIARMTVRRSFDEHTKKAGLPYLKIHEIRHTTNTWLLSGERSTDELKAITERFGRSSLKVTMDVYFHSKKDTAKKLADDIKIK
jgi:integrase